MAKRREIRNSTAEFLIFQAEAKEQGVEVYYKDENIWATQKVMATLFDVVNTIKRRTPLTRKCIYDFCGKKRPILRSTCIGWSYSYASL